MVERRIYLVRHLKTKFNESGVNMGRAFDPDIIHMDEYIKAFRNRVRKISDNFGINSTKALILTSPLRRCTRTAEILGEELGINNIEVMNELVETDMGEFSGKNAKELRREFGSLVDKWMFQPEDFMFPNGESYKQVRSRVRMVSDKLKGEYLDYDSIFLCTHVDIIKMLLSEILGFPFNSRMNISVPNGSVSVVFLTKDRGFTIESINA